MILSIKQQFNELINFEISDKLTLKIIHITFLMT